MLIPTCLLGRGDRALLISQTVKMRQWELRGQARGAETSLRGFPAVLRVFLVVLPVQNIHQQNHIMSVTHNMNIFFFHGRAYPIPIKKQKIFAYKISYNTKKVFLRHCSKTDEKYIQTYSLEKCPCIFFVRKYFPLNFISLYFLFKKKKINIEEPITLLRFGSWI